MSHKTLYIDIDEEITSIVDRVRKAAADEVIVVVPKKALLIQSLVNLKLLKKESDRRQKRLMIVTQDRVGKKLIEKAGILVQGKMDEDMDNGEIFEEKAQEMKPKMPGEISEDEREKKIIGSNDYFDEPLALPKDEENLGKISFEKRKDRHKFEVNPWEIRKTNQKTKPENRKLKKENQVKISDIVVRRRKRKEKKSKIGKLETVKKKKIFSSDNYFQTRETKRQKGLEPEKFFQASNFNSPYFSRKEEKMLRTARVKGRIGKYFIIFVSVFFTLGAAAGVYFFLPRATIILHLKTEEKSISMSIEANTQINEVDEGKKTIPAMFEQIMKEKSGNFEATGIQAGAGKAAGKVVIYNEFSSESQPLVVTTRLETNDGKIFRITKNIIVPGFTQIGAEMKPGAIEVDVVADKPGEEYNIEPTVFKIPGFKGGPKYEKFYAKSSKAMEGGLKGEAVSVTSQDLAEAKEKLTTEAKKEALEDLKSRLGAERYFFENTVVFDDVNSSSSEKIGSQAQKFTYTVSVKALALSFQNEDVKELLRKNEKANNSESVQINFKKNINYILSEIDIKRGFMKFEVKTDLNSTGSLDLENFKKGILGKNSAELENFIKNYSAIKSADVNFWPFFITRVPIRESRVKIEVDDSI